jgi:D-aminoacyl-tRNA deacylase
MSTVIISSTQDEASSNIKKALLIESSWDKKDIFFDNSYFKSNEFQDLYLITINDKTIIHEHLEEQIKDTLHIHPTKAIFISRHRSKSEEPTLTTHPIGNFASNDFGGKPKTLTPAIPYLMTTLLRRINDAAKKSNLYHKTCFEVTHHGPFMSIPTLFVEVGSSIDEWVKQKPATLIAKSLITILSSYNEIMEKAKDIPTLVGYGGGHYAPRFTDVALEKDIAFGHMIPSYHINQGSIDIDILKKAIIASQPVHGIYIHRKALKKSQVTQCKQWCKTLDIPVVSSNDFKNVS